MASTQALLKAYGNIPIPDRVDEMTYQEAFDRDLNRYSIRQDLMCLYERDVTTIKEDRGSCRPCYNCHDCKPPDPRHSKKVYSDVFSCAVNWNNGCPQPLPNPNHILNRQGRCKKCGQSPNKSPERKH